MQRKIIRKIIKQGSSYMVTIPPDLLKILKLKQGDKVELELKGKRVFIKAVESEKKTS